MITNDKKEEWLLYHLKYNTSTGRYSTVAYQYQQAASKRYLSQGYNDYLS